MASEIAPTKCRRNTPLYCGMTFSSSFPLLSSSPLFFFLTNRHCQWDLIKSVPDGSPFLTLCSSWLKSCPDNWSSDQNVSIFPASFREEQTVASFSSLLIRSCLSPLFLFPPDASSWLRDSKSSVRPEGPISGQAAPSSAKWWIADCIYTQRHTHRKRSSRVFGNEEMEKKMKRTPASSNPQKRPGPWWEDMLSSAGEKWFTRSHHD